MKRIKILSLILLSVFFGKAVFAQENNKKEDVIKIQTSAQCEMCKEAIEKALAYESGVISSDLDLETKIVTVKYKPKKTNPDKIRLAISKAGYDADNIAADQKAYKELPNCCKKRKDRE
jgi:periplasmic mercuric ion binding protein